MAEPFVGEIYEKGNNKEFDKTYETDAYASVGDAMMDVVYELEQNGSSIKEEDTQVILKEISNEEAYG